MQDCVADLLAFIDRSPTPYHAVASAAERLEKAGFSRLEESELWSLSAAARHYVVRAGGSLAAFTIYLKLLRDWGPSQAGLYAFVSPLIAVAVGMAVFGEPFGTNEALGSAVMLGAVALARANQIRCFRWRPGGIESPGHERL